MGTQFNDYCCGKIVEIFEFDANKLDVFKVIYKTEDDQYFYKYIHQFSANILLLNNDDERPSDYTDLEVAIYSKITPKTIRHDVTDQLHSDLLLKGWIRRTLNDEMNNNDLVNVISLLMNKDDYIGPNYEQILYLESKYWSSDQMKHAFNFE